MGPELNERMTWESIAGIKNLGMGGGGKQELRLERCMEEEELEEET